MLFLRIRHFLRYTTFTTKLISKKALSVDVTPMKSPLTGLAESCGLIRDVAWKCGFSNTRDLCDLAPNPLIAVRSHSQTFLMTSRDSSTIRSSSWHLQFGSVQPRIGQRSALFGPSALVVFPLIVVYATALCRSTLTVWRTALSAQRLTQPRVSPHAHDRGQLAQGLHDGHEGHDGQQGFGAAVGATVGDGVTGGAWHEASSYTNLPSLLLETSAVPVRVACPKLPSAPHPNNRFCTAVETRIVAEHIAVTVTSSMSWLHESATVRRTL